MVEPDDGQCNGCYLGPMRILVTLSQRPELTGSGITVDALVRHAAAAGHEPWVLCGVPVGEPVPAVGGLPPERVLTVTFGSGGDLPFAVPGMSDVMPYPSTVWSAMSPTQLDRYRHAWGRALMTAVQRVTPDLIHTNHLWLMSSLLPEVAPGVPTVAHCHATGLRQMALCPHLKDEVVDGLRRVDAVVVLHHDHARQVTRVLSRAPEQVHPVGAGYRDDLFHDRGATNAADHMLYVGKFAAAKGVPWLLDAVEQLWRNGRTFTLHVAGAGDDELTARLRDLAPRVEFHGRLAQAELAGLMRRCAVLVLPSFYEGLPLVLAEARACGCRLVSTALPGVVENLAPALGPAMTLVPMPRLDGPDTPVAADLPSFTAALKDAMAGTLKAPAMTVGIDELSPFTWSAVYQRVAAVWDGVLRTAP